MIKRVTWSELQLAAVCSRSRMPSVTFTCITTAAAIQWNSQGLMSTSTSSLHKLEGQSHSHSSANNMNKVVAGMDVTGVPASVSRTPTA